MSGSVTARPGVAPPLAILAGAFLLGGCFEAPPIESEQIGADGVGMQTIQNPDLREELVALNVLPEPLAKVSGEGPKAKDVYQNVQVLGDLSVAEFTRTMQAITNWVSPDAGCTYCHVGNNFADDAVYTKVVSRRMMQMTQNINAEWDSHVGGTGVTCLTCHRGLPVPEYIWFQEPDLNRQGGFAANSYGQNHANMELGSISMLDDPFSKYLTEEPAPIRVIAKDALPVSDVRSNLSTQDTENTYSLMIHMSTSLGQNCTYCHNTRAFSDWEQSPPARMTAWHGLQMVPALNNQYLEPLGPGVPDVAHGTARRRAQGQLHHVSPERGQALLRRQHARRLPGLARARPQRGDRAGRSDGADVRTARSGGRRGKARRAIRRRPRLRPARRWCRRRRPWRPPRSRRRPWFASARPPERVGRRLASAGSLSRRLRPRAGAGRFEDGPSPARKSRRRGRENRGWFPNPRVAPEMPPGECSADVDEDVLIFEDGVLVAREARAGRGFVASIPTWRSGSDGRTISAK